ncbi:MAG TPA: hypothetical protein VE131_07610, partial [Terriglobales bacterium]|nr:hypothetical protein [Terriglobales bacterium]
MRHVKLSYVMLIPFLALLLTVLLLLLGSANEISLSDFLNQSRYGAQRGTSLYELWRSFQLTLDSILTLVLDGKLIFFFCVSLLATAMTGLFAWKALQVYRSALVHPSPSMARRPESTDRRTFQIAPWASFIRLAQKGGLVAKLGGALSA